MTRNPEELQVRGLDKLISWFGRFPSFHDAELTSISLDRSGGSRVRFTPSKRPPKLKRRDPLC